MMYRIFRIFYRNCLYFRIFYFNTETKQPTWEMPVAEISSDLSSKQLVMHDQQGASDVPEK